MRIFPKIFLSWLVLLVFVDALPAGAQEIVTGRPGVTLRLKPWPEAGENGRRLFTVVNGKEYPIDRFSLSLGIARLEGYEEQSGKPAWYLDPGGKFLYFTVLTGCGFESDGMAIFRSDLFGNRVEPVVGSCNDLAMEPLSEGGKNYLLIRKSNSGIGNVGFWIFSVDSNQPMIHARGLLEKSDAQGKFRYCDGNEDAKGKCADVSMGTLLQLKGPIRFLPRFPLTARTVRDGVPLRIPEGNLPCGLEPTSSTEEIPSKGSQVVILDTCKERGVYEVYFRGIRGTVSKNQIEGFKVK